MKISLNYSLHMVMLSHEYFNLHRLNLARTNIDQAKKEAANGKEWGDPAGGLNADI